MPISNTDIIVFHIRSSKIHGLFFIMLSSIWLNLTENKERINSPGQQTPEQKDGIKPDNLFYLNFHALL